MIGVGEASITKITSGSAPGVICAIQPAALSSTVGMPELREVGIANTSGVACSFGLVWGTTAGVTPSGGVTVVNSQTGTGSTQLIPTYATYPTIGTTYTRQWPMQAVTGAGVIWTWLPGEWQMWGTASNYPFVVYQTSSVNTTWTVYIKVSE